MSTTRRRFLGSVAAPLAAPALLRCARKPPNVLWLMTDEQRPDSMGAYRSPWAKTPHLDELATEGTTFEEAYTPSPVCVPARTSLLTGQYGSTTGVLHNQAPHIRQDTSFLTWAFEGAGYRTASFGKKHYFRKGRQAFQIEGGRTIGGPLSALHYNRPCDPAACEIVQYPGPQPWILAGRFPGRIEETAEHQNVDLAINWLSSRPAADPFFLRLSLLAPHTPVVVPKEYCGTVDPDAIRIPYATEEELSRVPLYERRVWREYQGAFRLSREQIRRARRYYYDRVAFLDSEIGRLLDWMRKRDLLDNTIVVFVSDHGTLLGDHGLLQKQTFYRQVATVPFFFWAPGRIRSGARVRTPVNTISLLPALLECAGIEVPGEVECSGLQEVLEDGGEPAPEPVFSEIKFGYRGYRDDDRLVTIRDGRYRLTVFLDPDAPERFRERPEGSLYDLETDPGETRNLYGEREYDGVVERLQKRIVEWDQERKTRSRH